MLPAISTKKIRPFAGKENSKDSSLGPKEYEVFDGMKASAASLQNNTRAVTSVSSSSTKTWTFIRELPAAFTPCSYVA
jgi:hypothetical protein